MAPAAADFPDPLDAPATRAGDADDLISRLADEAIDRMIAEDEAADAPRADEPAADDSSPPETFATATETLTTSTPPRTTPREIPPGAADVIDADPLRAAGSTFNLRRATDPPATPIVPPDAPFAAKVDAREDPNVVASPVIDARPAEVVDVSSPSIAVARAMQVEPPTVEQPRETRPDEKSADEPARAAPPAGSVSAVAEPVGPASAGVVRAGGTEGAQAPTAAPPHATSAPAAIPTPRQPTDAPSSPPADVRALLAETPPAGLPVLLRPLEWLNAPFAALPESTRAVVGQIGILTLLNAAAVLAYVLIFRR